MNWEAIAMGAFGVAICLVLALGAMIWGGQGDGYHGSHQRDAQQTGGCLAIVLILCAVFIVVAVVDAHLEDEVAEQDAAEVIESASQP